MEKHPSEMRTLVVEDPWIVADALRDAVRDLGPQACLAATADAGRSELTSGLDLLRAGIGRD